LLTSILSIRTHPAKGPDASAQSEAGEKAKSRPTDHTSKPAAPPQTPSTPQRPQEQERPKHKGRDLPKRLPSENHENYGSRWEKSVPQHLLSEDRLDYERVLDEALRSAPHRPELAAVGQRLNPEQLRTMALNATAFITAAAAAEYHRYLKVREELRRGETAKRAGAGAGVVVAVLVPFLAGAAAVIFLLVGYVLKMVNPDQAFARSFLTTGWVFGAVTAATILIAAIGLVRIALRDSSSGEGAGAQGELTAEVARAREAWHEALLERGILPFLRDALADPGAAAMSRKAAETTSSRMPNLGYGRPGFSSPDESSAARPSFTSPDYASPDVGGSEDGPE
jgi:hypothetical protein